MSATVLITAAPAGRWRRTLAEHQAVNGRCPRCGTRGRCWEWAEAFGQLVAHDLLLPPSHPLTDDRPGPLADEHQQEMTMLKTEWTKSTFSGPNCDNCVECRVTGDAIEVRDSKNPDGPVHRYTQGEWAAFLAGAKDGQFDIPA